MRIRGCSVNRPYVACFRCLATAALCVVLCSPALARAHKSPAPATTTPAAAAGTDGPSFLGTFKDWSAYSRGDGDARVCYALSEPKAKEPAGVSRDPTYFLVND